MVTGSKTIDYTHSEPGALIPFGIAGFYQPIEENRIDYKGRELFYVTGKVNMEAPCCEMAPDWVYALVPGYVSKWQYSENENGEKVTLVEPVQDKSDKEAIREIIIAKEGIIPVDFW